jgi:hypothetical protein
VLYLAYAAGSNCNSTNRPARRPVATSKSQIIIRRPIHSKPHPRSRLAEDAEPPSSSTTLAETSSSSTSSDDRSSDPSSNELVKIRDLLRPPPIPGVLDWGIPAVATEPCDPAVEVLLDTTRHLRLSHMRSSGQACTISRFETRSGSTEAFQ